MGDRAQVCIKEGSSKVYLYGHRSGTRIYKAAAQAIREVPERHSDSEYFARAVFCRMIPADQRLGETGFGIGTVVHGDTSYPIPVFDCETGKVSWENTDTKLKPMTFVEFAKRADAGEFDNL